MIGRIITALRTRAVDRREYDADRELMAVDPLFAHDVGVQPSNANYLEAWALEDAMVKAGRARWENGSIFIYGVHDK